MSRFGAVRNDLVIKGILDWLANSLGLEHSSSHHMCVWCGANDIEPEDHELVERYGTDSTPWNDLSAGAHWRETIYRSAEHWFMCHGGRDGCSPLLSLPGVSGLNVMCDALHVLDLGFTHHCLGNVLFYI